MEAKIKVLPPEVADRISAGEVIDRPASVVKELVENSIDAGAERIVVEIIKGGRELIKITDNGCGMSEEDALLSLHRHSTSKLRKAEDIERVTTLGFRGEALPSIASVSRMRIKTRSCEQETGTVIYSEGGRITGTDKTAPPPGTEITVESLFFNTPARKKFMKSVSTEMAHINSVVSTQALGSMHIHFELYHNGKKLLLAPATDNIKERAAELFGSELGRLLIPLSENQQSAKLKGVISAPEYSRTQNNQMIFFVNSRPVKSKLINHAVLQAYRPLIDSDRFPFTALFIEIDPGSVDINIHPQKTEVKFLDPGRMHDFINLTLKSALNTEASVPSALSSHERQRQFRIFESVEQYSSRTPNQPVLNLGLGTSFTGAGKNLYPAEQPGRDKPLLQVHSTYIISEDSRGILLIDQHAAHEKILYEKLKRQHREGGVAAQPLLVPCSVETSSEEAVHITDSLELLEKAGFTAEAFGENTFILRTVPAELKNADPARLFLDIASDLLETGKLRQPDKIIERIISTAACRAALKAGDKLEQEEMQRIVSEIKQLESPFSCPHGRPTMIRIELSELVKKFKRTS